MGGSRGVRLPTRKNKPRRLSVHRRWNPRQRQWLHQVEKTVEMLAKLRKGDPLHGEKWRSKMTDYYMGRIVEMLRKAPRGLESYVAELVKTLGLAVD